MKNPFKADKLPVTEAAVPAPRSPESSQSGSTTGYRAEWKPFDKTDWVPIPFVELSGDLQKFGTPRPKAHEGLLQSTNMHGYEQAMALAWQFLAHAAADFQGIHVRVVPYHIEYNWKCYREENETIPVGTEAFYGTHSKRK